MGTVIPIKKWNLDTNEWDKAIRTEDRLNAFSVAAYEDIVNTMRSNKFHYILVASGYRVGNLTNNPKKISDRKNNMNKVINFFSSKRGNYRIEQILVDRDAPLREQSEAIALYIDELARQKQVSSISFLGFSKCGAIGVDMLKYFMDPRSFIKTHIYSISTPYTGSLIASPLLIERRIKEILESRFGKNEATKMLQKKLMRIYYANFSNSHMDLDIALPNGVKRCMEEVYDESFLKNLFSRENMEKIRLVNSFLNICTCITSEVRTGAVKSADFTTLGLCLLDEYLQKGESDGIVTLKSQQEITSHSKVRELIIPTSHNSLGNEYGRTMILKEVSKNIDGRRF